MGEVEIRPATTADLGGAAACLREVLDRDLGGYQERWHRDIDDLAATYLNTPRARLFVAVGMMDAGESAARDHWADLANLAGRADPAGRDGRADLADRGGEVLATAAVCPCRLASPPNPEWLVTRYNRDEVCQLVRVWVRPEARRRGLARRLVAGATRWATETAGYRTVYLHTDASVTGAESFWRSMPTVEVYDTRPDPCHTVHFEIDVAKVAAGPGWSENRV